MKALLESLRNIRGLPWICALFAAGLLLLLLPAGTKTETEVPVSEMTYPEQLEHRISQMADALAGVDDVSVLVTLKGSGTSFSSDDTATPEVRGIAVVCRGAEDAQVRLSIIHLLCAAFDIQTDQIWVGARDISDGTTNPE
ncbi:MAG: hypothetical protein IJ302_01250 [Clostridia bacterium]|nr:hypothetical protein [Clostridia bacterium]